MTKLNNDDVLAAVHAVRNNGIAATATTVAHEIEGATTGLVYDALSELVATKRLNQFDMVWRFDAQSRVTTPYYVP